MSGGVVYAIGVGIALCGFALHSWPRWFNRYFGVDNWRTLAAADYLRRGLPMDQYHLDRFLIPGASDYPPLFRYLIAAFPKSFIERMEWAVAPAMDALHSLWIFHVGWILTRDLTFAIAAQIVHTTSPLVMMENSSMSTRPLASLLFSLAFFPLVCLPPAHQSPGLVGIGLVFLTLVFLTHRLTIQALWVLVLVFSVWDRSVFWITIYLAGTLLALLVSRGFYWRVLRGQFAMFGYWRRNLPYRYAHQVRGLPSAATPSREPDALTRLNQWVIRHGACVAVLAAHPATLLLPLAVWWLTRDPETLGGLDGFLAQRLVVWGIALGVAGLLIRQVPVLRLIGDGERYLDAAVLPTALVVAALWTEAWQRPVPWLAGLIGTTLLIALGTAVYLQIHVVVKDVKCSIRPALWTILHYLKTSVPKGTKVAAIPIHLIPTVEYFTPCRVLSTDNSPAHITHLGQLYPYIRKPVPTLMAEYGIDYLVLNEAYARLEEVGFPRSAVVCQADSFVLVKTTTA